MSGNPNRQRLGKETMTRSAWAEWLVARLLIRRGCGNGCRNGEGSSSQTGPYQIVDPTQYEQYHEEKSHYYEQATQEEDEADNEQQAVLEVAPVVKDFLGALVTRRFYRGSVDTLPVGFGATSK